MNRRDHLGLEMSSGSQASSDRYAEALTLFHGYYGNPLAVIDGALAEDPEFLAGLALRAGLVLTSSEVRAVPELESTVQRAEGLIAKRGGNPRERAHIAAARLWLDGEFAAAADAYNRVALEHPRDALAVQVAHLCNFFLGRSSWLRDHVAAVLPHYDASEPAAGFLHGMLAFGLEECGEYARAEQAGRRALAQNPRDPWAVHAVAHCFEMQGMSAEGILWLEGREHDWSQDNLLAGHNFWHTALFHLDLDDRKRVLELYDQRIRGSRSEVSLDLVDASALLWRLWLSGSDVTGRFEELAAVYRRVGEEGYYAFNDLHALMAYAGAGAAADVTRVVRGLEAAAAARGTNGQLAREIALPLCQGFAAFADGDYARAIEALFGVRTIAHRFGGSHAQRDVIELTLLEAAIRDHRHALSRSLIDARIARKPESPAARYALARAFTQQGMQPAALGAHLAGGQLTAVHAARLVAARSRSAA